MNLTDLFNDPNWISGLATASGQDPAEALVKNAQVQSLQAEAQEKQRKASADAAMQEAMRLVQDMEPQQAFDTLVRYGVPIPDAYAVAEAKQKGMELGRPKISPKSITDPLTGESSTVMMDEYGNQYGGGIGVPAAGGQAPAFAPEAQAATAEDVAPYSLYDDAEVATGLRSGLRMNAGAISALDPTDTLPIAEKTTEARNRIKLETSGLVNALRVNSKFTEGERKSIEGQLEFDPSMWRQPAAMQAKMRAAADVVEQRAIQAEKDANNPNLPRDIRNDQRYNAGQMRSFLKKLDAPSKKKDFRTSSDGKIAIDPQQILTAKAEGFTDKEIADHLRQSGFGEQVEKARKEGASYNEIVRTFAGEETGLFNRLKQGMGDFDLAVTQMANYATDKLGLPEWMNRDLITGEQAPSDDVLREAIAINKQKKGEVGIGGELAIAAGNPANWIAAMGGGGALSIGMRGGAGYEMGLPQNVQEGEEFSPGQKAKDTAVSGVIGAATVPIVDRVLRLSTKLPMARAASGAGNAIKKAAVPFTKAGAEARAASRVQNLVPDAEQALARLDDPMNQLAPDLTPAQKIGDERLLGLQEASRKASPEQDALLAEKAAKATEQLNKAADDIGGGVPASKTTEYVGSLVEKAELSAAQKLAAIAPGQRASQASVVLRGELDKAYTAAMKGQRAIWDAIPKAGLTTAGIKNTYNDMLSSMTKVKRADIPEAAKKFLDPKSPDKLKNIESAQTLQDLRSKLLEESRNFSAGETPNLNRARLAEDLADAVLDDLGAQAGNLKGDLGIKLRAALDYSRELSETFRRGTVGKLLQSQKTGADRIAPELSFAATVGAGNGTGSVAIKEILKASPTREAYDSAQQYLLNNFNKSAAVKDGAINKSAALKWLKTNEDLMDTFPDIKAGIESAITASEKAAVLGGRVNEYLNAPVEKEFQRIITAKNPAKVAKDMVALAKQDKTGEALMGLKTATVDYLRGSAKHMEDKRVMMAAKEILSPADFARLNFINNKLAAIASKGENVGEVMNDLPNRLIDTFARVQAAKLGGAMGGGTMGGSLQTANIATQNIRALTKRLTNDSARDLLNRATVDDGLFRPLLMPIKTAEQAAKVDQKIGQWMGKNGAYLSKVFSGVASQEMQGGTAQPPTIKPQTSLPPQEHIALLKEAPEELAPDFDETYGRGAAEAILNGRPIPDSLQDLIRDEGRVHKVYTDTTGHRTVGTGFNMDSGIAKRVWKQAGIKAKFDDVYKGKVAITPQEDDALLATSYAIAESDAKEFIPKFDKLSEARQQAIINLSYQMGADTLSEFKKFKTAMNNGDYRMAAQELILSDWFKQTQPDRKDRILRQIMRG